MDDSYIQIRTIGVQKKYTPTYLFFLKNDCIMRLIITINITTTGITLLNRINNSKLFVINLPCNKK